MQFATAGESLPHRVPLKKFTSEDRAAALAHIRHSDMRLAGRPRYICNLLAALHERTDDTESRELILEAVWMATRMSDALKAAKTTRNG